MLQMLQYLLSINFLSYGFLDSYISGSSSKI